MTINFSQNDFCNFLNHTITWQLFIKVTNLCNQRCAHCCESSGPDAPATFIPLADVRTITDNFNRENNIYKSVAISGGEPMTAYKHMPYYIPQMMKIFATRGFSVELKTNSAWATQPGAAAIFADLTQFSEKYPKTYTIYHLSLDHFHANASECVSEFIRWYYDNDKLSRQTSIHVFFDNGDKMLTNTFVNLANEHNIMLDFDNPTTGIYQIINAKKFVNKDKYIILESYGGISNLGRAKQNHIATRTNSTIRKTFFDDITRPHSLTFDNQGLAFIDCNLNTASTPYKDSRGRIKPISTIKRELFEMLYKQYLIEKEW